MHRKIVIALTALYLTACSSAAPQNYRPTGSTDAAWRIDGHYNDITHALVVRVNGDDTIEGSISWLGGKAELTGKYDSKPVTASCVRQTPFGRPPSVQCIIFVSNERAATLEF